MTAKLLFRQVHPTHLTNGLSSSAFRPTPNDGDKLSVDCARLTTAKSAYELHQRKTRILACGAKIRLETGGTWTISRDVCKLEGLDVHPDPLGATQD